MKNLVNELDFATLKNNFDTVCDEVNESGETVTLTLKSNRKVYIMPEENYNNVSRFIITSLTPKTITL